MWLLQEVSCMWLYFACECVRHFTCFKPSPKYFNWVGKIVRDHKELPLKSQTQWVPKQNPLPFLSLHTRTHAYHTPTNWLLSPFYPQVKVCGDPAINLSTHHIDFRNHIDASNVNIHSHGHGGTCKPRWSATWFLRTSFILSKSCPRTWTLCPKFLPTAHP